MAKSILGAIDSLYKKGEIDKEKYDKIQGLIKEAQGRKGAIIDRARDIIQTLGLGSLAVAAGSSLASKIRGYKKQKTSYKEMLEKMPELKEYPETQVKDFFSVVKTFSPKAASNPLVAGALVNKMVQFGGVDHKLVQDLSQIEGPQKDVMVDITEQAAKSLAMMPKEKIEGEF